MASIEARQNRGILGRLISREAQPQLTPAEAWGKTFDAKLAESNREGFGVVRFNKGGTHITLQEYGGYRIAHFDVGDEHERRTAVAIGREDEQVHIVRSIPTEGNDVFAPGHDWEEVSVTEAQRSAYLRNTATDMAKSKLQDESQGKKWTGMSPDNAQVFAAIQKSKLR